MWRCARRLAARQAARQAARLLAAREAQAQQIASATNCPACGGAVWLEHTCEENREENHRDEGPPGGNSGDGSGPSRVTQEESISSIPLAIVV